MKLNLVKTDSKKELADRKEHLRRLCQDYGAASVPEEETIIEAAQDVLEAQRELDAAKETP